MAGQILPMADRWCNGEEQTSLRDKLAIESSKPAILDLLNEAGHSTHT